MCILKDLYNLTQPDLKVSGQAARPAAPLRMQPNTTRHFNQSSASLKGTMQTWVNHVVSARMAERQKRRTADRAGDLYTNDALSHGLIESLLIDIVNTGLTPKSQPMLRITREKLDAIVAGVGGRIGLEGLSAHEIDSQLKVKRESEPASLSSNKIKGSLFLTMGYHCTKISSSI